MPTLPPKHSRPRAKAERHGQVKDRQANRALNTSSREWRYIRACVLLEERYTCRACGKFGDQVDHIDGKAQHRDDYRRENLQTLCHRCHSAKTIRGINEARYAGRSNPGR